MWFGLVLKGNAFLPVAILWLAIHILSCKRKMDELALVLVVTMIGACLDSFLVELGVFEFATAALIPWWLVMLWACFAATLRHSLGLLSHSVRLQWFVGTFLVPLNYLAGYKFSAVNLPLSLIESYLILAFVWGPILVLLFFLQKKIEMEKVCYD